MLSAEQEQQPIFRRDVMKPRQTLFALLLITPAAAAQWQPVADISAAIDRFVTDHIEPNGNYQISVSPVDARLQLPQCAQTLETFSQTGDLHPGRNTLGVRCIDTPGWTIYNSVQIKSFKEVLILSKPANRNDIITPEHLGFETKEVSTLTQGYNLAADDALGKQLIRSLPAGTVLNNHHYTEAKLIKRGERVNIQAGKSGFNISMSGQALTDGARGQRINVKNLSSQRVIQATVSNPGEVQIYF